MIVVCINETTSISTNGHPIGIETLYINVGDQFDVNDEYLKGYEDIYTTNHTDGNRYSLWKKDFISLDKWREHQLNKILNESL